jgi:hypothetical protein
MEPKIVAAHAGSINGRMIKPRKVYAEVTQEVKDAIKKARQEQSQARSRYMLYKTYCCSVYMEGAEGRKFVANSLVGVHEAATDWLIEMKKWASYFKTNAPEIQFITYTGSDTPEIEDSWEDVRYNATVVGTDREVKFKDFVSDWFWHGSELEVVEEAKV